MVILKSRTVPNFTTLCLRIFRVIRGAHTQPFSGCRMVFDGIAYGRDLTNENVTKPATDVGFAGMPGEWV